MNFPPEILRAIESQQPVADPRDDEPDFLTGKTCNPNDPDDCEACQ